MGPSGVLPGMQIYKTISDVDPVQTKEKARAFCGPAGTVARNPLRLLAPRNREHKYQKTIHAEIPILRAHKNRKNPRGIIRAARGPPALKIGIQPYQKTYGTGCAETHKKNVKRQRAIEKN